MSHVATEKKPGWFTGLIDGAARAFAFGGATTIEARPGTRAEKSEQRAGKGGKKLEMKGLTLQVRQLAANGHTAAEIARRTALSQDTIALLLHLTPGSPDESAAQGTIFRLAKPDKGARS